MSSISRRDFLKLAGTFTAGLALTGLRTRLPRIPRGVSGKPNILILLFDAMSAPHLSVYGYPRPTTPNFERFAQRANVYHNHYSGGNFTTPGTASLLTGRYPWNHRAFNLGALVRRDMADENIFRYIGEDYHRFGFSQSVWADLLMRQFEAHIDEHMPHTMFSLKSKKPMVGQYFRGDSAVAYMAFEEYLYSVHQYINPVPGSPAIGYLDLFYGKVVERVGDPTADLPHGLPFNGFYFFDNATVYPGVEQAIARLHTLSSPFFGYFHLFAPHSPYCARKEFIGSLPALEIPFKPHHPLANNGKHKKLIEYSNQYDEYVATVDDHFGRLMDFLETEGIFDDTCVILTSDHGELFERGDNGHSSNLLFERIINIPLLISSPGQSKRQDFFAPTSNTDIMPTLVRLAGGAVPPGIDVALLPGLGGTEDRDRPIVTVESKAGYAFQPLTPSSVSMVKGDMKLIHYRGYEKYNDVFELYDLTTDREEKNDLMPDAPSIATRLKDELLTMLDEADRPFQRGRQEKPMYKLVLLRHGQSTWNLENRFTGWTDVGLTEQGMTEAHQAGTLLREGGYVFDIAITSVLRRAIKTLWIVMEEMGNEWIPVIRAWQLNERHYGSLQGLNKAEMAGKFGEAQVKVWRRSYDVPPPALEWTDERHPRFDPRYASLTSEQLPATESLKITLERVLPYWHSTLVPLIRSGRRVLVTAHGNSIRALVKYLDNVSESEITELNIPTGIPLVYELDEDMKPIKHYYLGDPEAVASAAAAVANQGKKN